MKQNTDLSFLKIFSRSFENSTRAGEKMRLKHANSHCTVTPKDSMLLRRRGQGDTESDSESEADSSLLGLDYIN